MVSYRSVFRAVELALGQRQAYLEPELRGDLLHTLAASEDDFRYFAAGDITFCTMNSVQAHQQVTLRKNPRRQWQRFPSFESWFVGWLRSSAGPSSSRGNDPRVTVRKSSQRRSASRMAQLQVLTRGMSRCCTVSESGSRCVRP